MAVLSNLEPNCGEPCPDPSFDKEWCMKEVGHSGAHCSIIRTITWSTRQQVIDSDRQAWWNRGVD